MENIEFDLEKELLQYNPAEEPKNEFEKLPDGDYRGVIDEVVSGITPKKGTPYILIKVDLFDDNYTGRKEFIYFFMSQKMAPFNAKRLMHLAYSAGNILEAGHFKDLQTATEALSKCLNGKEVSFIKKTKNDFANYDLTVKGI